MDMFGLWSRAVVDGLGVSVLCGETTHSSDHAPRLYVSLDRGMSGASVSAFCDQHM